MFFFNNIGPPSVYFYVKKKLYDGGRHASAKKSGAPRRREPLGEFARNGLSGTRRWSLVHGSGGERYQERTLHPVSRLRNPVHARVVSHLHEGFPRPDARISLPVHEHYVFFDIPRSDLEERLARHGGDKKTRFRRACSSTR